MPMNVLIFNQPTNHFPIILEKRFVSLSK